MELENEEFYEGGLYYNGSNDFQYEDVREEEESPSGVREHSFAFSVNSFTPQEEVEEEQKQESEVEQQEQPELEQANELELESEQQYKLQNIDTETLIKSEAKQLILTQVAEEMHIKVLNDGIYEIEEQIENLKGKEDELQIKIKGQESEVEKDNDRLLQCKANLFKTKEMDQILKENVESLQAKLQKCTIKNILEKSNDQHNKMEAIKVSLNSEIPNKKEKINEMTTTWIDRNERLKSEMDYLQKMLHDSKEKHNEMKRIILSFSEDIHKNLNRKQFLEQKLDELKKTRGLKYKKIENDIEKDNKQIQKQHLKKIYLPKRSDELKEEKLDLENQLKECYLSEVDVLKVSVSAKREETEREETRLNELNNQLDTANVLFNEKVQNLQQVLDNIYSQLDDRKTELLIANKNHSELHDKLNELEIEYKKKCEKKLELSQTILKQQSDFHSLNTQLVDLKQENNSKRRNLEELKTNYDACFASLTSLRDQTLQEEKKNDQELQEAKTKYELSKDKHNQVLNDMKKKKEYSQTTYNCLIEKSENLKQELAEHEKLCKNNEESHASLKMMIEKEENVLNTMKQKLKLLNKKPTEPTEKPESKLPEKQKVAKKVTFKETPSFKSTTESETSNQPLSQQYLKQDLHRYDWLKGSESESDEKLSD